jgi:hypothetical protein
MISNPPRAVASRGTVRGEGVASSRKAPRDFFCSNRVITVQKMPNGNAKTSITSSTLNRVQLMESLKSIDPAKMALAAASDVHTGL